MPCLLGLSATERSSLRSHYGLLADRLNLGLGQLAQKQPKIVGSAQEHELYFKDQQTLLHNFLRQEAVLTQRSMHEALPVETPLSL